MKRPCQGDNLKLSFIPSQVVHDAEQVAGRKVFQPNYLENFQNWFTMLIWKLALVIDYWSQWAPSGAWLLVGPSGRPVCMLYDSDPWPWYMMHDPESWYMHVCMIHDHLLWYRHVCDVWCIYIPDACINDGGSPERDGVGHKEQIVQLLWNKVGRMLGPEARLEMNRTKMTRAANANNTWEFQFNLFHLYQFLGWF